MFDFSIVTRWFDELLRNTLGLGDFGAILIECVVVGLAIIIWLCRACYHSNFHGT